MSHNTIYSHIAPPTPAKLNLNQASISNFQFSGYTEDREKHVKLNQNSDYKKFYRTNQVIQQINIQGVKK